MLLSYFGSLLLYFITSLFFCKYLSLKMKCWEEEFEKKLREIELSWEKEMKERKLVLEGESKVDLKISFAGFNFFVFEMLT